MKKIILLVVTFFFFTTISFGATDTEIKKSLKNATIKELKDYYHSGE